MGGKPVPGFALSLNYLAFTVGTFSGWYHLTSPNSCRGGKQPMSFSSSSATSRHTHASTQNERKRSTLKATLPRTAATALALFFPCFSPSSLFLLSLSFSFALTHSVKLTHAEEKKSTHTQKKGTRALCSLHLTTASISPLHSVPVPSHTHGSRMFFFLLSFCAKRMENEKRNKKKQPSARDRAHEIPSCRASQSTCSPNSPRGKNLLSFLSFCN